MITKCLACRRRFTTDDWAPFCSEICWDSADAEFQRQVESGYIDSLFERYRKREIRKALSD